MSARRVAERRDSTVRTFAVYALVALVFAFPVSFALGFAVGSGA